MRSVVRLTASATSALPRSLLLAICIIYASFGLFGRDPWKNEDAAGFGVMWTMANGTWHDWLLPNLVGKYITGDAPLSYWLGAIAIRALATRFLIPTTTAGTRIMNLIAMAFQPPGPDHAARRLAAQAHYP